MNPRDNKRNKYIYLDSDGNLSRIKTKETEKMTQRYAMEELLGMTSEDLQVLKDKAWLVFKRYDNALATVRIIESEQVE